MRGTPRDRPGRQETRRTASEPRAPMPPLLGGPPVVPYYCPGGVMKPFLMGTEAEYALSGGDGPVPLPPEMLYTLLNDAVRGERRWVPDVAGGRAVYLENGARLYLDTGGHPEYSTP